MRYRYGSTIVESGTKLDSAAFLPVADEPAKPTAPAKKPQEKKPAARTRKGK